jgi:hypothetical protein
MLERCSSQCSASLTSLVALPTNVIKGWKGLLGTNTLAFSLFIIDKRKMFYETLAPVASVIKLFTAISYDFSQ